MRTLQPAVRTLQCTVRLPSQRSTRLSYQSPSGNDKIKEWSSSNDDLWTRYREFLLKSYSQHTAKVRLSYSEKYYHILENGNAQELLILSVDKRIHVMKALAALSKYLGCYDKWNDIRKRYRLKWSANDGLRTFNNIMMNNGENYSLMMDWLKHAMSKLPFRYGDFLLFDTLTGLRPDEACKSIKLVNECQSGYLNKSTMVLKHFKFPQIFIRRTKNAYISVITEQGLVLAKESANCGYNALRLSKKRYGLNLKMAFCRKIFATHLRTNGIEQETIDLLQGRVPGSVFARHYFRPDFDYERIRYLLNKLHGSIVAK